MRSSSNVFKIEFYIGHHRAGAVDDLTCEPSGGPCLAKGKEGQNEKHGDACAQGAD
jgi:hypothetical protein